MFTAKINYSNFNYLGSGLLKPSWQEGTTVFAKVDITTKSLFSESTVTEVVFKFHESSQYWKVLRTGEYTIGTKVEDLYEVSKVAKQYQEAFKDV